MTEFKDGLELHRRGELDKAKRIYEALLKETPKYFDALHLLGVVALQQGDPGRAVRLIAEAILINSNDAPSYSNLGNALMELNKFDEALTSYDMAVRLDIFNPVAYYNRGNVLVKLNQLEVAVDNYSKAIEYDPNNPVFYYNLANTFKDLRCFEAAVINYTKCIELDSLYDDAYANRGNALVELDKIEEAIKNYIKALEMKPDCVFLPGVILYSKMRICDWTDLSEALETFKEDIINLKKVMPPLSVLSLVDDPNFHKRVAKVYAEVEAPVDNSLGPIEKRSGGEKIKIGYYSADFRSHAVTYLTAGMFETHDKNKFETFAFSFNPDNNHRVWKRIKSTFNKYVDVSDKTDVEIAKLSREMGIDIAINLGGHTHNNRTKVFALRCAPVQVNYLGYPGTMGAEYMDYIIADRTIIPSSRKNNFVEKVAYMPHCYQPNDSKREISDRVYTREDQGLPNTGFIFCCFNNLYKILPEVFDTWMRILKAVPDSVLWLKVVNDSAKKNLLHAAELRGIGSERIVFAEHIDTQVEHLARQKLADLFIDTFPFTAHTTASDALWAGVPVLTRVGKSYASRVPASLLFTLGFPELVTRTVGQYERAAVSIASDYNRLNDIKCRLRVAKSLSPLFNTLRFTRDIEKLYTKMYKNYQEGLPPKHII